ncbi:SDR family oxidoreductase [bacterium]|nr:SDR family oxidoreductase [bacterium]
MSFQEKRPSEAAPGNIPLAIVGLSCMFPKSPDKQSFWRVLRRGDNCIKEVPPTHWSVTDLYDGDASSPDRTYCKVGGFLEPYQFDTAEFAIPPNALEATDTSQLLALVGAKEALRDAGYGKGEHLKPVPSERTSVVLGVTGCLELVIPLGARLGHHHWRRALYDAGIDEETSQKIIAQIADSYVGWQENSFPGLLGNVVAGRVANKLDLHGTNCVVDAACASSLAALHLGMMELQTGSADMVISGGVDTFNDIFMFECFSKTPALSHKGAICPFSEDADGTLLGEGVGVVVLKRLDDAERDNDRIYAVIKGLGSSSDGNSGAIYAPDSAGQYRSIERAYQNAHLSPNTVDMVEAHGTGTKKGDVVEFSALQQFFGPCREQKQWCAMGTVKSQIGHTKAAAGSASLCKMALALYNKVLLPTINVSHPHPGMHIEDSAFFLNDVARPWLASPDHPRRGALSSFGFGGSNFHVIMEEYSSKRIEPAWDGSVLIFAFSASEQAELIKQIADAAAQADKNAAWTANKSCGSFDHEALWKATAVCSQQQAAETLQALEKALRDGSELPAGCYTSAGKNEPHKVAFLFPGQGSQYLHMGSEIAAVFPEVLQAFQEAEDLLPEEQRPCAKIFPLPSYSAEEEAAHAAELTDTKAAQVALGTIEIGLANVLRRFGVEPQAAAGHSYGELVALCTAGRISSKELFTLSALRGRLMAAGDGGRGGMIALTATEETAATLAEEIGGLSIANRNHPKQFVLTGLKESIQKVQAVCKERKITARPLQVSAAFHSALMATAVKPFGQALEEAAFTASELPVYANLSGDIYPDDPAEARQTLSKQLVSAVNFIDIINKMYERGFDTFVEVGPKAVLGGLVKSIMNGRPYHMMATDSRKGGGELLQLGKCLAELACLGLPVKLSDWETVPAEPKTPKFPVTLCGANYRRPNYSSPAPWPEPKEPAEGYRKQFPKARPAAAASTTSQKNQASTVSAAAPAPAKNTVANTSNTHQQKAEIYSDVKQKMNNNQSEQPNAPVGAAQTQAMLNIRDGLLALQSLQQQTALAHQRFLETQAQLQYAIQSLMMPGQQYFGAPGAMPPMPMYPPMMCQNMPWMPPMMPPMGMPAPMAPLMPPPAPMGMPSPMNMSGPMSMPTPMNIPPSMGMPTQIATPEPPKPLSAAVPTQASIQSPAMPAPAPAQTAASAPVLQAQSSHLSMLAKESAGPQSKPAASMVSTVLGIVAEKTGYPVDMITADMDMEADLGIDSIKRVEILAAIEEKLPNVKTITPDEIGNLHTLRQIIERLGGDPAQTAQVTPAEPAAAPPAASPAASGSDISSSLLSIIAEKTGYPIDMISVGMDMEADLGIDSIKRVEILAAIEERFPNMNAITPDEIGNLHTIQQVIERLNDGLPAPAATPAASAPTAASAAPSAGTAQSATKAQDGNFDAAVMQIVAEKTGYPADMLNLNMDIESDLGIDSIKRVEILAAIEERFPGVNSITPEEIGNLRTLRQIVERLRPFDPTTPPKGDPSGPSKGEGSTSAASHKPAEPSVPAARTADKANRAAQTAAKSVPAATSASPAVKPSAQSASAGKTANQASPAVKPSAQSASAGKTANQASPAVKTANQGVPAAKSAGQTSSAASAGNAVSMPPLGRLERRLIRYREALPPTPVGMPGGSGPYLLLDDGQLASYAKEVLEERGAVVHMVTPAQLAQLSPHYGTAPEIDETTLMLRDVLPSIKGLIAFIPHSSAKEWENADCTFIKDCFMSLQAAAPALSHGRTLFATVSRMDGRMGTAGKTFNPAAGGLHSLGKVVAQEWPECVCRAIDIDPDWDRRHAAEALIDELSCPGVMEVGLCPDSRIVPELCQAPFVPHHNHPWPAGQVIVVSGGARGVTSDCVKTIARYLHPRFVLLGRSPLAAEESPTLAAAASSPELKAVLFREAQARGEKLTPARLEKEARAILANREVRATLAELRSLGCQAEYMSLDVRDRQAVENAIQDIRSRYGSINALIHAAGVLADKKITDKTRAQFDAVFDTKVYGLINLLQATRQDDLRFIAFFSSVTARFGRPGQSDYAIANEIMNKAAHLEATLRPQAKVVSIGWGPWDGGMVNDGLRREFAKIGAELIPRGEGALALADEMVYGAPEEQEIIFGSGFSLPSEADICERVYAFPCSSEAIPALNDHAFGGRSVMPMALIMEYFCQAAKLRYPQLEFAGVDNLQVLKPIQTEDGMLADVVCASGISAGRLVRVPMQMRIKQTVYASAEVVMAVGGLPECTEAAPAKPKDMPTFDAVDAYERYLFHGISFQGLASIDSIAPNAIAATADSASPPANWWMQDSAPKAWLSDPLLSDCALQLGLIWSGAQQGCPSLPLGAQSYRQFCAAFPEQVSLVFKVTEHRGMLFQGEVVFCERQRVLAVWKGIRWMMDASLKEQFRSR